MTTEKISVIHGEEATEKQSSIWKNGRMECKSDNPNINYWSGLHVFTVLCCCSLAMSVLTLIPRHNSILEPAYWFEVNIPSAMACFIVTTMIVLDFIVIFEKNYLITIKFFLMTYLATYMTVTTCYCTIYIIWTVISEYNHPMPHVGVIVNWNLRIVSMVSLFLILPREFSREEETKKKLRNFAMFQFGWMVVGGSKILLALVYRKFENTDAQCAVAFLIPIAKISTNLFLSKMMNRVVGMYDERANLVVTTHINLSYGLFVAVSMVGARPATVVCMVLVDVLLQLIMTCQIVKLHNKVTDCKNGTTKTQKRKAILNLVLDELCEGLIPMAYAISFAMAYYGPNAELIGNVKNGYWQYKIDEDISHTFLVMFGIFLMSIVFLALNSSILWMYCKVNLLKKFCSVLKKYWYILAIKLVNGVWWQFYITDVNLANDTTGQFGWITNDRNLSLT